mgnify:CR=1 FL=1
MPSVWIDLDGYKRYSNARSLQTHESVFARTRYLGDERDTHSSPMLSALRLPGTRPLRMT